MKKQSPEKREWEREDVLAEATRAFPHENRDTMMSLLDEYGIESYEQEQARVQVAVLKLSDGDLQKLRHYVKAAKTDYRNVLWWSDVGPYR